MGVFSCAGKASWRMYVACVILFMTSVICIIVSASQMKAEKGHSDSMERWTQQVCEQPLVRLISPFRFGLGEEDTLFFSCPWPDSVSAFRLLICCIDIVSCVIIFSCLCNLNIGLGWTISKWLFLICAASSFSSMSIDANQLRVGNGLCLARFSLSAADTIIPVGGAVGSIQTPPVSAVQFPGVDITKITCRPENFAGLIFLNFLVSFLSAVMYLGACEYPRKLRGSELDCERLSDAHLHSKPIGRTSPVAL